MSSRETTPLLPEGDDPKKSYYFLGKNDYQGGMTPSVRDVDGDPVLEEAPQGSTEEEFAPRILLSPQQQHRKQQQPPQQQQTEAVPQRPTINRASSLQHHHRRGPSGRQFAPQPWWKRMFRFGGGSQQGAPSSSSGADNASPHHLVRMRKAPIKVEPKVFFANERTFLAWMHLSVILAGASIAILAFGQNGGDGEQQNVFGQLYGLILLPVAISFILYSLYQYNRRATMIRYRHPGPYEDTVGPVVMGVMLMISIVAQFALKLYEMATY